MHLSRYLQANPGELQNNLTFLQDIYVRLNDPDGVAGAAELRKKDASLKEKIIEHKAQGEFSESPLSMRPVCAPLVSSFNCV